MIAVNMILAGASGGIVAIIIATWAQVSARNYPICTMYNYITVCKLRVQTVTVFVVSIIVI